MLHAVESVPELTNRDVVVVVDADEVTELQVTSSGSGLTSNTLHGATVTEEEKGVVVDEVVAGLVVHGSGVCLGNSKTNGVGETLTERTSGHLNTGCVVRFRVTGCDAVDCAERLQVVHAERVAEKVEEGVVEHDSVAVAVHSLALGHKPVLPPTVVVSHLHSYATHAVREFLLTYDSTNLSLLTQSGFFGLKVMNLFQTTWATGAIPMGAPGWPELALAVASTWETQMSALLLLVAMFRCSNMPLLGGRR